MFSWRINFFRKELFNKVSKPFISPRYTSPLRRLNFSTNSLHILHICNQTTEYLVSKSLSTGRGSLVLFMLAKVKINHAMELPPRVPHLYQSAILCTTAVCIITPPKATFVTFEINCLWPLGACFFRGRGGSYFGVKENALIIQLTLVNAFYELK